MFVIRCPVRIHRRDRPLPRAGTFSGAAPCHNFWPYTLSDEYREVMRSTCQSGSPPGPLLELLELLQLLELLAFHSPQQRDGSVLQSDFVDGAGTFPLVDAGENHVDGRLRL
jgi:hypothetical protein